MPRFSRVSAILLMAAAACVSGDRSPLGPAFVISDGMHAGGTPGFFFLPPMVSQPTVTGVFDADIATVNPVVVICDVTDGGGPDFDCGVSTPALRTFTTTSNPPIRVESDKYKVNWDTKEGAFAAGRTYRVYVLGGTPSRVLGFADILLTNEPGKAKNLAGGDLIVLNDGRTLPIHFRIERGVIVRAGPAVSLDLTGLSDPTVAGTVSAITVTAHDANGNIATGYTGTIAFTSNDAQAMLPGEYTFTAADAGTRAFPASVTPGTAGSITVTATDQAVGTITGAQTVTVTAAAAAELRFTTQPTDAPAGAPIAPPIVITAYDQFGNLTPSFTGQVTVGIGTNPGGEAGVLVGTLQASAALGVATFDDLSIGAAGNGYTLVASATELASATSDLFDITATDAVALEVSGLSDPATAGTAASVTVTARDEHGNIATSYAGTIAFTSTDLQATLPGEYAFAASDAGTHVFPASVTLRTAGSATVTATDQAVATIIGAQTVTVAAGAAAEFVLAGIPDPAVAGVAHDLSVTARDVFGNTAAGYAGIVQFSSSDPAALLPGAYQFQATDAGVQTFPAGVTFKTAGNQTLQASDAVAPAITGSVSVTVSAAAASALRFTTQPSETPEGTPISPPVVVTAFDQFGNVAGSFTGQVTIAIGTNPGAGVLSGTLQVNAAIGVATFSNLSISADGAGYTLVAAATGGGVTSATSDPFTVTAVAPTEVHWISAVSGAWSDGTKWSTGAAPTPDQAVFIDASGTYTVTLDVNATVNSLTLGAASGVQTLSAGSSRILAVSTSGTILTAGRLTLNNAVLNGPGAVTNAGVVRLINGDITSPFTNQGTLIGEVLSSVSGALTTVPGSILRALGTAAFNPSNNFTIASGFTNYGTIELTNSVVNTAGVLTVSSGTLVNAAGATISALAGAGGGIRTLAAQLDNQGTLTVAHPLTINRSSADHTNSGVVTLTGGNLTVNQSGTTPSFTNTGTVTVPTGRTWTISGTGSFTQATGATLDGGGAMILIGVNPAVFGTAFTLSALSLNNTTASFATDITTETLALTLNNSTVNGPGTLTNAAGKTLTLNGSDINTPLVNAGTLVSLVSSSINGTFTMQAGSLLRVLGTSSGSSGWAVLTVGTGFINQGAIELTNTAFGGPATLTVTSGSLVNAPTGTISVLAGAGGGTRTLAAQLDNQGTLDVGAPLTLNRVSADHLNSGLINLTGGNLTLSQSGTTPSFTNTGTITVPAGRTWIVTSGSLTHAAGATLNGGGAVSLNNATASFAMDITTETLALTLNNAVVNGPGTLTNAADRTLTLNSSDINAPLVNAGTLVSLRVSSVNGAFTTGAGSLLRVQGYFDGFFNTSSSLTVAGGFTNNGAIELTTSVVNTNATLTVSSGTLVNAAGGTISVLAGAGGGTRTLTAQLENAGTLTVAHPLAISRGSADHTNSGTIAVTGGDLTITQSGTTPTFTNSGVIDVAATRALRIGVGPFANLAGGSIQGLGTFEAGTSTPFSNAGSVTVALMRIGNALTGSGTFAPVTAEFFSNATSIPVGTGYSYTNVRVLNAASFTGSTSLAGNLTVAGSGNLTIGAHTIFVEGNFATQNGTAFLTMQNAAGILEVQGAVTFGGGSTNTRLTAGTLRVAGDFVQSGSAAAFAPTLNHVTVLNGAAAQTVSFANPGTTTTLSHFHRLEIDNANIGGVTLGSAAFANGQLRTPAGPSVQRIITSAGRTLQVGGLSAVGLVLDATSLRVVTGDALTTFDDAVFRNMDPTVTQFRLDRLNDVVTFNNTQFLSAPTTGVYLHLVDTNLAAPLFTVTMAGTQPPNHGGKVIESVAGQLLGWPF